MENVHESDHPLPIEAKDIDGRLKQRIKRDLLTSNASYEKPKVELLIAIYINQRSIMEMEYCALNLM